MPKVSVIVPIFNVDKYLKKSLNSILAQTLEDIEIICVDDGSSDGSSRIIDEYAGWDERIKAIHKTNGGYGHSMNIGLEAATGDYIGIVESDDMILPHMYQTLYEKAIKFDLDIIKSDCYFWWESFNHLEYGSGYEAKAYYNMVLTKEFRKQMFLFWMFTWSGIYKRSFIIDNNIRWNETPGASYQDNGFWIQTMAMANRAMWVDDAFYLYRQDNPASSMKDRKKIMAMTNEYDFAERILKKKGLDLERRISNYFRFQEHIVTYRRISDELKEYYRGIIIEQFDKYKDDVIYMREEMDPDWVLNDIMEIINDSEGNIVGLLEKKKNLDIRLRGADHIVFYGSGYWANNIWKRLYTNGYTDLIEEIAETNPKEGKEFWGRPIINIDDFIGDKSSTLVILAVGETLYPELENILKGKGFSNIIGAAEVSECLWAL